MVSREAAAADFSNERLIRACNQPLQAQEKNTTQRLRKKDGFRRIKPYFQYNRDENINCEWIVWIAQFMLLAPFRHPIELKKMFSG